MGGYGGHSYVYRTTEGLTGGYGGYGGYLKRSAEPGYGYSGVSYYHRSPQGVQGSGYHHGHGHSYVHQDRPYYHGAYGYEIDHEYKKRAADAGYGDIGYNRDGLLGYGYLSYGFDKREAEPGYGYSGVSYYHRSPQGVHGHGYHKRSAEPGYHHGHG